MTIATIGGAGDAGKTTVLDLLGKEFAKRQKIVLSIDANPDQNLLSFAGFTDQQVSDLPKLCNEFDLVKQVLEGENPFYPNLDMVVSTSPVTHDSKRWSFDVPNDKIMTHFAATANNALYMQTGTYTASDLGTGCLHSKIENLVFALERLDDGSEGEKGMVLVDQAHGRDAFGTPLYAQGDMLLIVTKPNKKSLDILSEYIAMAQEIGRNIGHDVQIGVVGNMVQNDAQAEKIKDIAGDHYIASMIYDPALEREESNTGPQIEQLLQENQQSIALVADRVETAKRDWNRRKAWLELCHFKADWYDTMYGTEVREQKTDFVVTPEPHVHGNHCKSGCHHH